MKVSFDQAYTAMSVEVSICTGEDIQNWCVSLFLRSKLDIEEEVMTVIEEKIAFTKTGGACFPFFQIFLFVRLLFEYVNNSSLLLHADFYLQVQDNLYLEFEFRQLKNYLQSAYLNMECNCPGER